MKARNEVLVGLTVLLALALVVAGALWLGERDVGKTKVRHVARFRQVGGLGVGNPVTLRGVRVGRVEEIRLAEDDWVEAELSLRRDVALPARPAVISASASLFGEWQATVLSIDQLPEDPLVRQEVMVALEGAGERWPGASLPDIGQLTAQASRIAGDVGQVTQRITGALDTAAVRQVRQSILELAGVARRLSAFSAVQMKRIDTVGGQVAETSRRFDDASARLQRIVAQLDSSAARGDLRRVVENAATSSDDLRQAAADLRAVMAAARGSEGSLVRVVQTADSLLARVNAGQGTLGKLAQDSALYTEATATLKELRELLADIRARPKRYFGVSLF